MSVTHSLFLFYREVNNRSEASRAPSRRLTSLVQTDLCSSGVPLGPGPLELGIAIDVGVAESVRKRIVVSAPAQQVQ